MRSDKRNRAISQYNGHRGPATVAHVERNLLTAYPEASRELTGKQYGRVMSACNTSYHDGAANATALGDVWDYNAPTDWIAGIGKRIPDGNGGAKNQAVCEVSANCVTITIADGQIITYIRQ